VTRCGDPIRDGDPSPIDRGAASDRRARGPSACPPLHVRYYRRS